MSEKGYDNLDDAAAAALWGLREQPIEHMGALYASGEGMARTDTITRGGGASVRGTLAVPPGALRALFHNHPATGDEDYYQSRFSPDDKAQARRLRVPSYISAGDKVMRYDPRTGKTEEVLAEFPIAEMLAHIDRL